MAMSAPPPSKRFRPHKTNLSSDDVTEIILRAQKITFPWNKGVPENISNWFEAFGKSHDTAPEYVFIGAVVVAAVLMGPKSFVKVRETYSEPTNLFAVCIGHSGSGKSQSYGMTVQEPLQSLPSPLSQILVDDHTRKGLFKHLQQHSRALLAYEELGAFFDLIRKRQHEGTAERQLFCRLYEGKKWTSSTGTYACSQNDELAINIP